jgi:hypothetical protein
MANFDIVSDLDMWLDDEVTEYELRESIIDCENTYNLIMSPLIPMAMHRQAHMRSDCTLKLTV